MAGIHDIVMQKGCGVDKLHRCRKFELARTVIAAQTRSRQGQQGAQPFAAGRNDMARQLPDQWHITVHTQKDDLIDGVNILAQQGQQVFKRIDGLFSRRAAYFFKGNNGCHVAFALLLRQSIAALAGIERHMTETTLDKLLNGRFAVEQPAKGYRIAVDTLLLAAAVPAQENQHILDMGCGVGGVMLALATRIAGCTITGIEIQPYMAGLCKSNIQRNGLEARLNVIDGDVQLLPEELAGRFDHVMLNPPYNDAARHGASPTASKKRANTDEEGELPAWIAAAARALKTGGLMTMINRSDREAEIVALCTAHFTDIRIKPIWSKADGTGKRIIIRASNGQGNGIIRETPFILYGPDGRYSEAGESILRHAQAMD